MGRPFKCPYCGSVATASKGTRRTKTLGIRRLRRCRTCKRKFTPKHQPSVCDDEEAVMQPQQQIEAEAPAPDFAAKPLETSTGVSQPAQDELLK